MLIRKHPAVPAFAAFALIVLAAGIFIGQIWQDEPQVVNGPTNEFAAHLRSAQASLDNATQTVLAGKTENRDAYVRAAVESANKALALKKSEFACYLILSKAALLDGNYARAAEVFDEAIRNGAPEEMVRTAQCVTLIVTADEFRPTAHPMKFDIKPLSKNERVAKCVESIKPIANDHFVVALRKLLDGKDDEVDAVLAERPAPPHSRLLLGIALYNTGKFKPAEIMLRQSFMDFPTPQVAAMFALAQAANGHLNDAMTTVSLAEKLKGGSPKMLLYLDALFQIERSNYADAEKMLKSLDDGFEKTYSLGVLDLMRNQNAKAREYFEACGDRYQALYGLACIHARKDEEHKLALEYLAKAINGAKAAGEYGRNVQMTFHRQLSRTLPLLLLSNESIWKDPMPRPLGRDKETEKQFKQLIDK